MNAASISVTKQFGFGLNVLVQNLLRKFERRGRVNTQTGTVRQNEVETGRVVS